MDFDGRRPPDQTIAGHAMWWTGDHRNITSMSAAYVDFGTCRLLLDAGSQEETLRVIEGLQTADCNDTATWWDVRDIGLPPGIAQGRQMPIWLPSPR